MKPKTLLGLICFFFGLGIGTGGIACLLSNQFIGIFTFPIAGFMFWNSYDYFKEAKVENKK